MITLIPAVTSLSVKVPADEASFTPLQGKNQLRPPPWMPRRQGGPTLEDVPTETSGNRCPERTSTLLSSQRCRPLVLKPRYLHGEQLKLEHEGNVNLLIFKLLKQVLVDGDSSASQSSWWLGAAGPNTSALIHLLQHKR